MGEVILFSEYKKKNDVILFSDLLDRTNLVDANYLLAHAEEILMDTLTLEDKGND